MAGRRDIEAGRAFVTLYVKNSAFLKSVKNISKSLRSVGDEFIKLGRTATMAGAAMVAAFALATHAFVSFDDQMRAVKAFSQATEEQFEKLTKQAKELGRTTSYTATQVAEAMATLSRSGFKPHETEAAISTILSLAKATGTDLAEAAGIASGTLRAFEMDASKSSHVADVLTAAANNSAQTLTDLGESMMYAAPIAQDYGMTLEDTAKAIGMMANYQIKGTMAGTALKKMMASLADPALRQQLDKMGISTASFGDTMTGLGVAMATMSGVERIDMMQKMFGLRAFGGALKLTKGGFEELGTAIDNAGGVADKTAAEMEGGIGGALRRVKSAFEGIQIAIGDAIDVGLSRWSDAIAAVSVKIATFIDDHHDLVVQIGYASLAVTGFGATLLAVGVGLVGVSATITSVITVFSALSALIATVLSPAFLIGAGAIAAVSYAAYELYKGGYLDAWIKSVSDALSGISAEFTVAWKGISDAIASGDLGLAMEIAVQMIRVQWLKAVSWLTEIWQGFEVKWSDMTTKMASIFIDATAMVRKAWSQMLGAMTKAWDSWKTSSFTDNVGLMFADIAAGLTGQDPAEVRRAFNEDMARARNTQPDRTGEIDAATAAEQAKIEASRLEQQAALKDDKSRADMARKGEISKAEEAVEKARRELLHLGKQAAYQKWATGTEGGPGKPGELSPLPKPGELAVPNFGASQAGKVLGTFSSAAALAMSGGGQSAQERSAKSLERLEKLQSQQAKATQDLANESEKQTTAIERGFSFGY